jgi:hypothetical protein
VRPEAEVGRLVEPFVDEEPDQPRGDAARSQCGPVEDVLARVVQAAQQPVGDEHAEQRDEDSPEQEQEALVAAHVDRERCTRRDHRCADDQQALRHARNEVLRRDGRRVDVGERLVRLVDGQREQRQRGGGAAAGDRGQDQFRVVRVDAAREHENRAEAELEERGQEVADADAEESAAPVAREARVVRDQWSPRNRHCDDRVDGEPERAVMSALRPDRVQVCAVDDPPREVDHRRDHGPDRELADEAPHEPDGTEQGEHCRNGAEEELPEPDGLEAEQLVAQEAGRGRDHDQLEDRPAETLQDVQRGREVGAAAAERRPLQDHRRNARVGADQRRDGEHAVPDHRADERRGERGPQRQVEVRRQDEHQQRDAEVRPQQRGVKRPEHAEPLGYRLDSPTGRLLQGRPLAYRPL